MISCCAFLLFWTYAMAVDATIPHFNVPHQNANIGCSMHLTWDQDRDGFWDQAEAELVWAFAPWIEFDEKEDFILLQFPI